MPPVAPYLTPETGIAFADPRDLLDAEGNEPDRYARARGFVAIGRWESARRELASARKAGDDPTLDIWHLTLHLVASGRELPRSAEPLPVEPDLSGRPVSQQLARAIYRVVAASRALGRDEWVTDARRLTEHVLRTVPDHPQGLEVLAGLAWLEGDEEEARSYRARVPPGRQTPILDAVVAGSPRFRMRDVRRMDPSATSPVRSLRLRFMHLGRPVLRRSVVGGIAATCVVVSFVGLQASNAILVIVASAMAVMTGLCWAAWGGSIHPAVPILAGVVLVWVAFMYVGHLDASAADKRGLATAFADGLVREGSSGALPYVDPAYREYWTLPLDDAHHLAASYDAVVEDVAQRGPDAFVVTLAGVDHEGTPMSLVVVVTGAQHGDDWVVVAWSIDFSPS